MQPSLVTKFCWIFTFAVFCALLLPVLFQQGMFLDGITYATISKNLANGLGSIWSPHYTATLFPEFYEHPPLVFYIQSLFFRVFGDGMYIERIYTFFTALISLMGIVLNWRLFTKSTPYYHHSWLPVLLWIATPVVFWSYQSNMLENTLAAMCLFAVYFLTKYMIQNHYISLLIGSLFIFLAFLTKGPVGLFPLATIPLLWITTQATSFGKAVWNSLLVLVFTLLIYGIAHALNPEITHHLTLYLKAQVMPSIEGSRENTTGNHFAILGRLVLELIAPMVLLLLSLLIAKRKRFQANFPFKKEGLFFLCIGLAASLPLTITLKQRGYYLVTALPYFILGISILLVILVLPLVEKIRTGVQKKLWMGSIVVLIGTLLFSVMQRGKFSRDEQKIKDVIQLVAHIPPNTTIAAHATLTTEWGTVAYLARMGNISLSADLDHVFLLLPKNEMLPEDQLKQYTPVPLHLTTYQLYRKHD